MNIGIITFQETTNYGALLQAFAMQKAFEKCGTKTELINYSCKEIEKRELPPSIFNYGVVHIPGAILQKLLLTKKYKKLERFKRNNCIVSEVKYDRVNIASSVKYYDKFVSGSDIIWEMNVTGEDETYFLDFVEDVQKKYALSSSFGYTKIPYEYEAKCTDLLKHYKNISVREFESAQIIKGILNKDVLVTLDPTLFMDAEFWDNYEEPMKIAKPYVLVYFDDANHKILDFAKKIAREKNCSVVYLAEKTRGIKGVKMIRSASIGQFLWLINNADTVVTASFHGVAFSVNYKTDFYYLNRIHQGRINTLMKHLEINTRDFQCESCDTLDWKKIDERLKALRNQAFKYINSIIHE